MIPLLVPEIEGGTLSVTEEKEQKEKKKKKYWSWSILVVGCNLQNINFATKIQNSDQKVAPKQCFVPLDCSCDCFRACNM